MQFCLIKKNAMQMSHLGYPDYRQSKELVDRQFRHQSKNLGHHHRQKMKMNWLHALVFHVISGLRLRISVIHHLYPFRQHLWSLRRFFFYYCWCCCSLCYCYSSNLDRPMQCYWLNCLMVMFRHRWEYHLRLQLMPQIFDLSLCIGRLHWLLMIRHMGCQIVIVALLLRLNEQIGSDESTQNWCENIWNLQIELSLLSVVDVIVLISSSYSIWLLICLLESLLLILKPSLVAMTSPMLIPWWNSGQMILVFMGKMRTQSSHFKF